MTWEAWRTFGPKSSSLFLVWRLSAHFPVRGTFRTRHTGRHRWLGVMGWLINGSMNPGQWRNGYVKWWFMEWQWFHGGGERLNVSHFFFLWLHFIGFRMFQVGMFFEIKSYHTASVAGIGQGTISTWMILHHEFFHVVSENFLFTPKTLSGPCNNFDD